MSSPSDLFSFTTRFSRFWLPALLNEFVTIPAALCDGDECSIFIRQRTDQKDRLYLAATTRPELRPSIFGESTSYTMNQDLLCRAAEVWERRSQVYPEAGLTGWVGAFNRVLNLKDVRDEVERRSYGPPVPVWSNKTKGYFDWEDKRPFLAAPMLHNGEVVGVAKITTLRPHPHLFTKEHEQYLLDFGAHMAEFLVSHNLLTVGMNDHFRIWAATDGATLADRLTEAVPRLFRCEFCSFFQRDSNNRFVLASTNCADNLSVEDRTHFEQFKATKRNLYYTSGGSKTGFCIERQEPLIYRRSPGGNWEISGEKGGRYSDNLNKGINPLLLVTEQKQQVRCEVDEKRSCSLMLIPVRDEINRRMLAGVLRLVSTSTGAFDQKQRLELSHFADELAHVLGETTTENIRGDSCQQLTTQLARLELGEDNWRRAAETVAKALDADAVTIFLRDGDHLRSRADCTYLNEVQIRRDKGVDALDNARAHHHQYISLLTGLKYEIGEGRTGWPAGKKHILNLKSAEDKEELYGFKVKPLGAICEIKNPGPFLAAPLMLRARDPVEGVVRALRWQNSRQGPFSAAHELILQACAPILATLLVCGKRPSRIVISYSTHADEVREQLCRFLCAIGCEPLFLPRTDEDPAPAFEGLMNKASAGIALVTPRVTKGGIATDNKMLSSNVMTEIGMLIKTFGDNRVLILKDQSVSIENFAMLNNSKTLNFETERGIYLLTIELAEILKNWFNP